MLIKMKGVGDQANDLVGRIYDTCIEPDSWSQVQEKMCAITGGVGSHILLFDSKRNPLETLIHSALDERAARMMEEDYFHWYHQFDDYRIAAAIENGSNVVVTNDELTPADKKKNCPLFNEYFRYYDAEEQLIYGSKISGNSSLAIVHARSRSAGIHTQAERDLFLYLSNHIRRAMEMRQRLRSTSCLQSSLVDILSYERHSVVVVDRNKSIVWANDHAHGCLLNGSFVKQVNGCLSVEDQEQNKKVDNLIQQAIELSCSEHTRCGFMRMENGRSPMLLTVFSSSIDRAIFSDSCPVAILIFSAPFTVDTPALELIQNYFKLTPAEARLAYGLAEGKTIAECAIEYNIKISTARSSLKVVMNKMGCRRQPELVRMVLALVV